MPAKIQVVRRHEELPENCPPEAIARALVAWLAPWGDPLDQTLAAFQYVFSPDVGRGGFLVLALDDIDLAGALVMLDTGMGGYIPRHHLVYVAVDPRRRGHGLGAELVSAGMKIAGTVVSLHVDADNPAVKLYERLGFATKYLEMRTTGAGSPRA
jgi:ribosomal-protein-alanine N-acetyltransferase